MRPLKTGQVAPSYKPSVLVNDKRIIIAHAVHGSSETEPMAAMLAASARTIGQAVSTLALDAGYCCATILFLAVAHELDLLCPEGQTNGDGPWTKKSKLIRQGTFHLRRTHRHVPVSGATRTQARVPHQGKRQDARVYALPQFGLLRVPLAGPVHIQGR